MDSTGGRASDAVNGRHELHRPDEVRTQVGGVRLVHRADVHQSHGRVLKYQVLVVHRRVEHRKVRVSATNFKPFLQI